MIVLLLLVLAMVFCIVGFMTGGPWHGLALLLTILALLLPRTGLA